MDGRRRNLVLFNYNLNENADQFRFSVKRKHFSPHLYEQI